MSGVYSAFAQCYDALTFNVPYDKIAEYYAKNLYILTNGKRVLDMGCGTGSLTVRLSERGFDMIGQDSSCEMLSIAANKSHKVQWICQDMSETELGEPADAIISTLDSINHLPSREKVSECFRAVSENLKRGGLFAFDVNTIYKHREVLGNNTFVYDVDGVYCVWQNTFSPDDNGVDIDLDLFFEECNGQYSRSEEHFREIALDKGEICKMLESAGFQIVNIWDYLTFDEPREDCEKMFVLAKLG